jgi:DNA mismatch repair ATPase MutS
MLYVVKKSINKKISNMNIFLKQAINVIESVPSGIVENFVVVKKKEFKNIKFTNLFKLWKDTDIRSEISDILIKLYTIDVIQSIGNVLNANNWCKVDYDDKTIMWNAKNPILGTEQKANPVNLSKNLIITGPNAAGKTTYIKTILSNIILSQTFGISNSLKSTIKIYDTIASLMRISDILGSRSYFEAEAEYCKNMMLKAQELYKNGKNGLFLLDEPMHSTPPTEGVSTAYAVAEHIGNLKNINVLLTTHFHRLTSLETQYPDTFINLSVNAIKTDNGFQFPYKINRGHSYQCIAIELLSTKDFPDIVIESAINMKNKICSEIIR